ncbi:VOC family protein [Nitrincola nitratireducens]|uniref:2-oxoadipate dioxygenase/decarboxylase n=1 Tax=Nitrincola nitratireducens TaxID=1229521 RepID=W9UZ06_9GAMM|nr:VOC family protein [Nitrincola nitratireducens]EXJ12468.1 hypothetical protein D791_00713 [Nitrincola nitratireducens]
MSLYVSSDEIRDHFSKAMSVMYQEEVPQYAALLSLVEQVNQETLDKNPALAKRLTDSGELDRISVERHGAIRVGTAAEIGVLRRLFAVMGMSPVGYYDLSVAGVPVHSTAFRPIDVQALARNPFRIFTSLLRLELIENEALREKAAAILGARQIFSEALIELIALYESQGGLNEQQAERFITEAINVFRWHQEATVDYATYQSLHAEHRLVADVVCFKGPHINHLTPRTLNIDWVQERMPQAGLNPKDLIEGPPYRVHPILLRQTSFKALDEAITFAQSEAGSHSARFGEIEQRGVALTAKGRQLYDQLLVEARAVTNTSDNKAYQATLADVFKAFPDDELELHRQRLAFFEYQLTSLAKSAANVDSTDIDQLIENGWVTAQAQTYEDFLPVSAAGIFQSNLGDNQRDAYQANANQSLLEEALGVKILDEMSLYAQRESDSLKAVFDILNR